MNELCDPVSSDDATHLYMYGPVKSDGDVIHSLSTLSSRTGTTSFPVRCWRSSTTFCNRSRRLASVTHVKYSHDWSRTLSHPRPSSLEARRWSRGDFWVRIIPTFLQGVCSTNGKILGTPYTHMITVLVMNIVFSVYTLLYVILDE